MSYLPQILAIDNGWMRQQPQNWPIERAYTALVERPWPYDILEFGGVPTPPIGKHIHT